MAQWPLACFLFIFFPANHALLQFFFVRMLVIANVPLCFAIYYSTILLSVCCKAMNLDCGISISFLNN